MPTRNALSVITYLENVKVMSSSTAPQYERRLKSFSKFTTQMYEQTVDILIDMIKTDDLNVYEVLAAYASYLLHTGTISSLTLKQWVVTAKNLLEFHDIDARKSLSLKSDSLRLLERTKKHLQRSSYLIFLIQ